MVATYEVQRITGSAGSPTRTTVTTVRLRTDDANTADITNPCLIDSVLRRSFWASICLNLGGSFTQISNIRHYSNGDINWTFGTNGKLKRGNRDSGDHGVPDASYQQATGTIGLTGDDLESSHAFYSSQTVKSANVNNDTSSSPALIDSTLYTTPGRTKHIVLQVEVDTNGSSGVMSAKTLTFVVDEIN
jgi:hypothetical protein